MAGLSPEDVRVWQIYGHLYSAIARDAGPFATRLLWEAEGIDDMSREEKVRLFARLKRISAKVDEAHTRAREADPMKGIPHHRRKNYKVVQGVEPGVSDG